MRLAVHIILVGFDRDRLVTPITKGKMPVHKVLILRGKGNDSESKNATFAASMAELVKRDLLRHTSLNEGDISEERVQVHEYEGAYDLACTLYERELAADRDVYVNISSMPRSVSFAFATAANNFVVSNESLRGRLHVYYAAPQEYLILPMIESIESQTSLLDRLRREALPDNIRSEIEGAYARSLAMLNDLRDYGTTKGVKPIGDALTLEIPFTPSGDLRGFEERIVALLDRTGAQNVTQLATQLAQELGSEKHLKSKVMYNIHTLAQKGLVELEAEGRNIVPHLTTAGRLWVKHHLRADNTTQVLR